MLRSETFFVGGVFFEKDACGDSDPLVRVGEYFSDVAVLTYQQG